jgi:hypothetical protein
VGVQSRVNQVEFEVESCKDDDSKKFLRQNGGFYIHLFTNSMISFAADGTSFRYRAHFKRLAVAAEL